LFFMKRTPDRLLGDDYLWTVPARGGHQMNFCTAASTIRGNGRVGLEDSLYIVPRELANRTAEQGATDLRIPTDLRSENATSNEAGGMLGRNGAGRVKFQGGWLKGIPAP